MPDLDDIPLPDEFAQLWFLVRRVATLLDRTADARISEGLGISLAQFLVLSVVDAHPGEINQQQVADRLGLTKGTVSRQIDTAASAGLLTVTPSPRSRRANIVEMTPAGTALVRQGDTLLDDARGQSPTINPADLAATIRTLGAMNRSMTGQVQ